MVINIIDREFNFLGQIDEYESFIISKKWHSIGNFELHLNINNTHAEYLQKENIIFTDKKKAYVILYREIDSVTNKLVIKGLELKSYLGRWVVFPPTGYANYRVNSNVETIMKEYVQATLTRKGITNIVVADNQNRGIQTVYQSRYKNLADELEKLSLASNLSWDITLDLDNKRFIFDVVEGRDVTVNQDLLPPAIFSIEYDNIGEQKLVDSKLDYRNTAIVAGQGEGIDRAITVVGDSEGLDSFETFIDARDIENDDDLPSRGTQKLSETQEILTFDSQVLTDKNLVYEEDFKLGDKVTKQNRQWNITTDRRITETTEIYESTGFRLDVAFGEGLPTILDLLKKATDTPISEGSGGSSEGYPVSNIIDFRVAGVGDKYIELSWEDPPDTTITDSNDNIIVLAKWEGTMIRRKIGSYPVDQRDGELLVDSKVRDEYKNSVYKDMGLINDTEYFYMAFPYTDKNVFTVDGANRISATPTDIDDPSGSPGNNMLIAGTMEEGFFGEVPASEFITGNALTSECGISQGYSQHSTAGWLKFAYKGEIQFVAKKTIRESISWDAINTAKCVYGDSGDKTVVIDEKTYKVTLMRALEQSNDPKTIASEVSGSVNHHSEWNRLMCQIHEEAVNKNWGDPDNIESDIGILEHSLGNGSQGMYDDDDLVLASGNGRASWCQEMSTATFGSMTRGSDGVSHSSHDTSSSSYSANGWRPVLRLIS